MRSPSSSESSSTTQTRMGRARKVKRDLSTIRKAGTRKETMPQDEPEPENPMVLLESITRESEDEEDHYSLNEVKRITLEFSFLIHLSISVKMTDMSLFFSRT